MKKTILLIFPGIIIIGVAAAWWLATDIQRQLQLPLALHTPTVLKIKPGTSLTALTNEIVSRGWLPHPYYLIFEGRRRGLATSIKAGEYELKPGITPMALLDRVVAGKVIQYSLTIPEGWTFKQIIDFVENSDELERTLGSLKPEYIMQEIGATGQLPEGRFFPETYHFPAGTTDVQFLRRAYETMQSTLMEEWRHRVITLPYRTPYEALIMASIIEKETALPEERGKIAGVFVRRLQRGIKLQTDPTVIYAMGATFDGNIRQQDLSIDSPYNTYLIKGLPPTPIAAPGRASIRAALHPEEGSALYFVATGDGRHHFSNTLPEHKRAVAKYQLKTR